MTGTSQLRGNSKSSLVKTTTRIQLNHYNDKETVPQCLRVHDILHSLVASYVERHGTQHNFRPHALHSSSYSQVQLTTEGEMRSGAEAGQRLQGLSETQQKDSGKLLSFCTSNGDPQRYATIP